MEKFKIGLERWGRGWDLKRWTQFWFEAYLFFIPFTHWVALRNISLFLSLGLFLWLNFRRQLEWGRVERGPLLLGVGIGVSNLVGLFLQQVDLKGSLFEIWTNLFEDLYILVVALTLYRDSESRWRVVGVLGSSYLVITYCSGVEVVKVYLQRGWEVLMDRAHRGFYYWWGGFSRLSALYLPITAGWVVKRWPEWRGKRWLRGLTGGGVVLGFLLMLLYRSSAPIVFTSIGLGVLALLHFRPKPVVVGLGVIGLVAGAYLFDRTLGERKIFNPREYDLIGNQWSFNGRGGQWRGFLEMLDTPEKWLFGYGYGWKKFGAIAVEQGYRERFRREGNWNGYRFFCCYGSANPHNGYLEVLIESGLVGEVLFLGFLGYRLRRGLRGELGRYVVVPFLISYIGNSFFNGYWEGNGGKLLFLIVGIG